jgi:urocanate hydratase
MPTHFRESPPVRAAHGTELRCRGWRQEGLLRMLENTVQNGERPSELIIYAATGQAARNWECFDEIVACLMRLGDDETLVIQSGKPVGIFRTTEASPRVVVANTQLVGRWATWETFHELKARDLIMYGQYTAGDWQFIGQQGVVQSTFETLAACARKHFGGTLDGRVFLSAGLGGMGGAQPLAARVLGAVALLVEVDPERVRRRLELGYVERSTDSIEEALAWVERSLAAGEPGSMALLGNAADVLPALLERGFAPDVVTDQTSAHDARYGYVPAGRSVDDAKRLRAEDPARHEAEALASMCRHVGAMVGFQERGAVVFEYGNALREQAARAGQANANDFGGFVQMFIRPSFEIGRGPCRWIALSGDPADIRAVDEAMLEEFADDDSVGRWIRIAMDHVPHQGLPARTSWLDYRQRVRFGLMVNRMVASGAVSAPMAMTRDHLDSGAVAQPTRETEGMRDGSDAVADWPVLNAMLNVAGGADLVALHQGAGSGMGGSISAGVTLILDGTPEAAAKAERVLRTDPGIGVIRHADAGYELALDMVRDSDIVAPMLELEEEG